MQYSRVGYLYTYARAQCTPRFCISGTARPIVFKFGVWVWSHYLTRAPLGYFYNAPHWGGGAISSPPPLISEINGPILKIQAAFESPGKTVEGK